MPTAAEQASGFFRAQSARVSGAVGVTSDNGMSAANAILEKFKRFEEYGFKRQATAKKVQEALISVDASAQEALYEAMAKIAPPIYAAYRDIMIPLAMDVVDKWPTRTGLSKSLVTFTMSLAGGYATASIKSAAPYTTFIKWGVGKTPKGYTTGKNVWVSLVSSRLKPTAEAMAKRVGAD